MFPCAVFVFFLLLQEASSDADRKFLAMHETSVTFYLFNRLNTKEYIPLTSEISLKKVDINKQTFLFIHGWTESRNKTWYENLKNALLEKFEANIVQVDYSKPASKPYPIAVFLSKSIAQIIAKFILQIPKIDLKNVTIIGHSLGGQIAGSIGKQIYGITNKKIGKIIALDPAGPLFTLRSEKNRLTEKDAIIVEAIHTDRTLGYYKNIGHVDFYINANETKQPGCENIKLIEAALCNHHVSYKCFIKAIQNGGFVSTYCESELEYSLGNCQEDVKLPLFFDSFNKTGAYFLETKNCSSINDKNEE